MAANSVVRTSYRQRLGQARVDRVDHGLDGAHALKGVGRRLTKRRDHELPLVVHR